VRLILDPQALLWALAEPEKLPPRVADALTSQRNTADASAVNT
jgi:PIN domain nuclease of toxin-antitoxin system